MKVDLVVVGASFAGLACARAAAARGCSVVVVEKKQSSGTKLHTTGIIVKDAIDSVAWLAEVPRDLVRRIDGVRLYAPDLRHIDLFAPGYYFWATDAPALLDWMVQSVRADGVDVRLATLFDHAVRKPGGWQLILPSGEMLESRYLVGADGPHSRVAKSLGLSSNTEFLFGVEHEYAQARLADNLLHCFVDRSLAPGYIGWALAGVGVSQIGLARRLPAQHAAHHKPGGSPPVRVEALLQKISGVVQTDGVQPVAVRAGMIPCGGLLTRVSCAGALLVGDAAGMVSPVTAGGIHTALLHGEQAGAGIGRFLAGECADPAGWLVAQYPRFRAKRALRWLFDHCQTDWMFNCLLGTKAMRRAAELVYFHRKGGVSLRK